MKPQIPTKTTLARIATRLAHVTAVAILALPIIYLALWIDPAVARRNLAPSLPGLDQAGLPSWAVAAGFCLGVVPLLVLLYGLWQVHRFFQLYRANDVFPAEAGRRLRNFGIALSFSCRSASPHKPRRRLCFRCICRKDRGRCRFRFPQAKSSSS